MAKQKLGPLQEEWLRCLESGEWPQCEGVVASQPHGEDCSYCCLGVACEVALQNGVEMEVAYRETHERWAFDGSDQYMPKVVQNAMNFRSNRGTLIGAAIGEQYTLAAANDNGETFKEIAAFVRKYPEAVFTGEA